MSQYRSRLIDRTSLSSAQQLISNEESQVQAEIDAFEDFLDRLDEIPPHPYRADGGSLRGTVQSRSSTSHTFSSAVQKAYRETVLAVDHWEDEYGENTVLESITNEFSPEVAAGLASGSEMWSQPLWDQLKSASEEAIETRQHSYSMVTTERQQLEELHSSLIDVGEELAAIERGEFAFEECTDRLTSIEQQLDDLTRDQQSYLHQRKRSNEELFTTYVYSDLDTDYPGLAAIATTRQLLDRIELRHWASAN
ncbi:DUF7260 family protein [Haladaptatus caseinilyticus]|uniref:DUF7260 family protein n=1 Tax=Haladaptatus caseinilyticus TaxID=2993314 RepID=UPI00224B5EF7|nr:hypothetical protein [Haladaptatus caseinilyticus]